MKQIVATIAIAWAVLAAGSASADGAGVVPVTLERPAHFTLVDGAPSIDALIDRVLDALAKRDLSALHRVRVTEDEYRRFVLPGSAKPGDPPKAFDEESSKFAWQKLDTNSVYAGAQIIKGYGGHKYALQRLAYLKGHGQYAWYETYNVASLTLRDESGNEDELVLGSIAEIDGQFKFISLLGNR